MTDPSLEAESLVAERLGVDPSVGLSASEAARRLAEAGPNELRGRPPVPLWRRILGQFQDPLVYLLLAAVAISTVAWAVEGAHGIPIDAVVIAAIVLLNGALGFAQEAKAEDAVAALRDMTAASATVLRDESLVTIAAADVVPGDVLVLDEGDAVAADGRLVTADALMVAEAALTGESASELKQSDPLLEPAALGDRTNMVFKGTAVVQGVGRAVVTSTGMATEVGKIAELLASTVEEPTPLQREVARLGRLLGAIVIVIALVVMLTILLIDGVETVSEFAMVLLLGVSLAVAAVPEGLPAILSVVLSVGVQRMAKRNAVVKKLSSAESLGSASVICTDKTGTLTRNEMTVQRVVTASGSVDVTGVGYRPDGRVEFPDDMTGTLRHEAELVLSAGSLANNAQLREDHGTWKVEGDPTEAAILVGARKLQDATAWDAEHLPRRAEIPFTSERKMMSTLHSDPASGKVLLFSKGAPDVLLGHCTMIQVGDSVIPLTDEARTSALADVEALSAEAFRTLGVAYRILTDSTIPDADESLEHELIYVGVVAIIDPPRSEVAAAIAEAHRAGIRVIMITGDHPATAGRIAADLGIFPSGGRVVTGRELDELDDAALVAVTRQVSVYARVAPEHKLRLVDALQRDGHIVAMTGDGVNDAPALKSADIGVAMGITGTEVTKEAARMILADDNFATIVAAVRQGRVIFDNIRKFLRYLLSSNIGEVLTIFLGVVFAGLLGLTGAGNEGVILPLLATQILWINLVTDSGPALAMGVDPEIDDTMARAPRGPDERAIDGRMWRGILFGGSVMAIVTLLTIDLFLPAGLIEGADSLEVARTAGFTTLVFAQLFNALNARSELTSAFRGALTNRWLWGSFALAILLQVAVVELPFLQAAFGTVSMDSAHWFACVALASAVLWYSELRKLILRRGSKFSTNRDGTEPELGRRGAGTAA